MIDRSILETAQIRAWIMALIVGVVLTLPWIGQSPLVTRGEGREAIVADDIIRNSNWILPSGYGENVPSKPPMIHWIAAVSAKISGGLSEFSLRLPSSFASVLLLTFLALVLSSRLSKDQALLSIFILATSFEWSRAALAMRVDMLLAASIAAALLSLFVWEERSFKGYPFLALTFLTVGVLSKGPVAIVLTVGCFGLYLLILGHRVSTIFVKVLLATLPAVIVPLLWYFAAYRLGGERFFEMVWEENFARFAGTMEDAPHVHSSLYLLGTMALGFMPWTLLLVPGSLIQLKNLRPRRLEKPVLGSIAAAFRNQERIILFSEVCCLVIFTFFCIPASKRSVYLLPLYPFASVLLAKVLSAQHAVREDQYNLIVRIISAISLVLLLSMLIAALLPETLNSISLKSLDPTVRKLIIEFVPQMGLFEILVFSVSALILVVSTLNLPYFGWENLRSAHKLTALSLVLFIFVNGVVRSYFAANVSPVEFAKRSSEIIGGQKVAYTFEDRLFSLDYYLPQKLFEKDCGFRYNKGDFIFVKSENISRFKECITGNFEALMVAQSEHGIDQPGRQIELYRIEEVRAVVTGANLGENQ